MNQLFTWMDKKTLNKDNEQKKYKSRPSKLNKYSSNNRIFSSRVACRINRSKFTSKWTKKNSKNLGNFSKCKLDRPNFTSQSSEKLDPDGEQDIEIGQFQPLLVP